MSAPDGAGPSKPTIETSQTDAEAKDASDTSKELPKRTRGYLIPDDPKDYLPQFDYSIVPGCFAQSLPSYVMDNDEFNANYAKKNFGILNRILDVRTEIVDDKQNPAITRLVYETTPDWHGLVERVKRLNDGAAPGEFYKVLYLARHGQGPHNLAIETWGKTLWDNVIAKEKSYLGLVVGPDPDLTEKGKREALEINALWKEQIQTYGLSKAGAMPQKFYASPFTRAVRTLELTWNDIVLQLPDAPTVYVREMLRETIGRHYCDQRGKMSELARKFPWVEVEAGASEEDTIWTEIRENEGVYMRTRLRMALDRIFLEDGETFISITAHSGCIARMLEVLNHTPFPLETSKMIPVVVKATLTSEGRDKWKPVQKVVGVPYTLDEGKLKALEGKLDG